MSGALLFYESPYFLHGRFSYSYDVLTGRLSSEQKQLCFEGYITHVNHVAAQKENCGNHIRNICHSYVFDAFSLKPVKFIYTNGFAWFHWIEGVIGIILPRVKKLIWGVWGKEQIMECWIP